jgi:hypothetical protein
MPTPYNRQRTTVLTSFYLSLFGRSLAMTHVVDAVLDSFADLFHPTGILLSRRSIPSFSS